MAPSSSHVTSLTIGYVVVSDGRKLKSVNLKYFPAEQHPLKML
jgi:hypothetical protein